MPSPMRWVVATAVLLATTLSVNAQDRIEVTCESAGALERALNRAKNLKEVDIILRGVCVGHYTIETDGVTLRGATPESGLAAPGESLGSFPVLEVIDAQASLRGLTVQGGSIGVWVHGLDAELLLVGVEVHGQESVGAYADAGARLRLIDSTVRDSDLGVLTQSGSSANLQRVTISNHRVGVTVFEMSFAALNDTTIENCRTAGLSVHRRSDANVLGGLFRENGQVHLSAVDRSGISLLNDPTIGSETDSTEFAMGATRSSRISSFGIPAIYGDASALDRGSLRLGETILHGDLITSLFSDAHVRDAEIIGSIVCNDGSDVICSRTTTSGSVGCASSTCGPPTADATGRSSSTARGPIVKALRFERQGRPPERQ
jgi:hypothetical protein